MYFWPPFYNPILFPPRRRTRSCYVTNTNRPLTEPAVRSRASAARRPRSRGCRTCWSTPPRPSPPAPGVPDGAATATFLENALFMTVTNVNFDAARVEALIREGNAMLLAAGAPGVFAASAMREQLEVGRRAHRHPAAHRQPRCGHRRAGGAADLRPEGHRRLR